MPQKTDSKNPADWLLFAGFDLEAARLLLEAQQAHTVCQAKLAEAVEKILKAELTRLGWPLLKTHDLEKLADFLDDYGSDLLERVRPLCTALAEAYITERYPGFDLEDPDWPKLQDLLDQTTRLMETIKSRVGASSKAP